MKLFALVLIWEPNQIQAQEVYLPPTARIEFPLARASRQAFLDMSDPEKIAPPTKRIEFPLARAARQAFLDMSDPEKEIAKEIYDRSFTEGVLPNDIGIDAVPTEDKPPPQRHAYITWARLLKHGFTRGCPGRTMGHNRDFNECKARFDAIFFRRGESVGPTPKPVADEEETDYEPSIAPDQFPGDKVPEPGAVRQGQMMKELCLPFPLDSSQDLRFSRAKTRLRP